jgi:putative intracellular protease/amidase
MTAREVLFVASNYGVWNEELQAPWDILAQAGHQLSLATPFGKKPLPLAASMDPEFIDPIQQYRVNTPEACQRMRELIASEIWTRPLKIDEVDIAGYDALVMVGGLGADLDMANNPHLHRLILDFYRAGKLICAICFALGALAFTRVPETGYYSIIHGRRVTAHPRAWDFKTPTSYELYQATEDNHGTDLITPGFLLPMQDIVMDAVGSEGVCLTDGSISRERPMVVYDHPFITACSVESSIAFGEKIADVLSRK